MKVYIAHPFAADIAGNTERVRAICREVVAAGHVPIAPQLYLPAFLDEATERETALRLCEELVIACDALWLFGAEVTAGMQREIAAARRRGIPVVEQVRGRARGDA